MIEGVFSASQCCASEIRPPSSRACPASDAPVIHRKPATIAVRRTTTAVDATVLEMCRRSSQATEGSRPMAMTIATSTTITSCQRYSHSHTITTAAITLAIAAGAMSIVRRGSVTCGAECKVQALPRTPAVDLFGGIQALPEGFVHRPDFLDALEENALSGYAAVLLPLSVSPRPWTGQRAYFADARTAFRVHPERPRSHRVAAQHSRGGHAALLDHVRDAEETLTTSPTASCDSRRISSEPSSPSPPPARDSRCRSLSSPSDRGRRPGSSSSSAGSPPWCGSRCTSGVPP